MEVVVGKKVERIKLMWNNTSYTAAPRAESTACCHRPVQQVLLDDFLSEFEAIASKLLHLPIASFQLLYDGNYDGRYETQPLKRLLPSCLRSS